MRFRVEHCENGVMLLTRIAFAIARLYLYVSNWTSVHREEYRKKKTCLQRRKTEVQV